MENKEDLVDWINKKTEELAKELGLKPIKINHPMKEEKENAHVTGTITFLKGESAKRAATIYGRHKWETIKEYENILLHIPHSSTLFPSDSRFSFKDLDEEEKLLIDYYTDELFKPSVETKDIISFIFPYCRLFCDVERLVNDPLQYKGLGISYKRTVESEILPFEERSFGTLSLAFKYYADFHAFVSKKIVDMTVMNRNLLIDCHSFSSLPNLLNSNPPDIDICIGYNNDETYPSKIVIGNIVQYFKAKGYKVGINEPFSNSKTFSVPVAYHSVMIEVNKRLYMDEQTLEKTEGFERLKLDIQSLYDVILER